MLFFWGEALKGSSDGDRSVPSVKPIIGMIRHNDKGPCPEEVSGPFPKSIAANQVREMHPREVVASKCLLGG